LRGPRALRPLFPLLHTIEAPGTVDGGLSCLSLRF